MTTEHKHKWKRSSRKHGREGRFFVVCEICEIERQASISSGGALVVFTTGIDRGGKTILVSFRLDKERHKKYKKYKVNARRVLEEHLDKL